MTGQYRNTSRKHNNTNLLPELTYEVRVSWNPNHAWYQSERESDARYEYECCLGHANGATVELLHNGRVIASNASN